MASDDSDQDMEPEMCGVRANGDGSGVPRASFHSKKISNEEDSDLDLDMDSSDSAEAQMEVDIGHIHYSEESKDKFKENSCHAQGSNDSASGGLVVHDKFNEFADAYNAESPPNWREDNYSHGTFSPNNDNNDQSKNHELYLYLTSWSILSLLLDDSDGTQCTPQPALQHFQRHDHAEQWAGFCHKVAMQCPWSVLSQQGVPPQQGAPSSHIVPSQHVADSITPSPNINWPQHHQVHKTRHRAPTGNRSEPFEDGQVCEPHCINAHY